MFKHQDRKGPSSYLLYWVCSFQGVLISSLLLLTSSLSWKVLVFQSSLEFSQAMYHQHLCEDELANSLRAGVLPWSRQGCNLPSLLVTLSTAHDFFPEAERVAVQFHIITAVQCSHISGTYKDILFFHCCVPQASRHLVVFVDHSCVFPWRLSEAVCSNTQVDFVLAPLTVSSNVWKQPCLIT